jgi:predicted small metal-binding protein
MIKLSCKESGLDCDYIVEGRTEYEVLERISEHAINIHHMREEDIYDEEHVPVAFLCQAIGKMTSIHNQQN